MKTIFIFLTILLPLLSFSQEPITLTHLFILQAEINGVDETEHHLDQEAYLSFYKFDNDSLVYLANVWSKDDSQSYGRTVLVEVKEDKENESVYLGMMWYYYNTYDNLEGFSDIHLNIMKGNEHDLFQMDIIPENKNMIIQYAGVLTNPLDVSQFNVPLRPSGTSTTE